MEYSDGLVDCRKIFEHVWINKYLTEPMVDFKSKNISNTLEFKGNTMIFDLNVDDEVLKWWVYIETQWVCQWKVIVYWWDYGYSMFIWIEQGRALKVRWLYVWLLEWVVELDLLWEKQRIIISKGNGMRVSIISSIVMMRTLRRAYWYVLWE